MWDSIGKSNISIIGVPEEGGRGEEEVGRLGQKKYSNKYQMKFCPFGHKQKPTDSGRLANFKQDKHKENILGTSWSNC